MIGCDVVSVDRIAAALRRDGFAERVFTARERDDARRGGVASGSSTATVRLAARFAAKEAARKALGDLSLGFHDTEVRTRGDGAPELWVGDRRLPVSLTHDAGIAMAVVLAVVGPVDQVGGTDAQVSQAVGAERDGPATSREGREKLEGRGAARLRPGNPPWRSTNMLLNERKLVITGVLDPRSIAFHVARLAQEQGAEIVVTGFGRGKRLTERTAGRLPDPPDVLELDATSESDIAAVAAELEDRWGHVDGVLHAIAFAPESCLGGGFLDAPWEDVATALQVSTYSLAALGRGFRGLLAASGSGGSLVGLDFDATVAWPGYDWMGVAKAGLESTARYLARDLGPDGTRVNLVAAGPLSTVAARSIDGFGGFEDVWRDRAPLGWDLKDPVPVARAACWLLSGWSAGITGEIVHVDGGVHAMGAGSGEGPEHAP